MRAVWLLVRGDIDRVNHDFQPKSAKEEVKEELDDFAQRRGAQGVMPPSAEFRSTTGEAA